MRDMGALCVVKRKYSKWEGLLDAGAGCWILDAGCWMLDAGCWMLDTGYWILDTGYWILDTGGY
ncbi:MAG: hypothetical protein JST83_00455 [Bacteroidetes bacterium]|nr:hypothetical protein [Bacteroidota bacterium]